LRHGAQFWTIAMPASVACTGRPSSASAPHRRDHYDACRPLIDASSLPSRSASSSAGCSLSGAARPSSLLAFRHLASRPGLISSPQRGVADQGIYGIRAIARPASSAFPPPPRRSTISPRLAGLYRLQRVARPRLGTRFVRCREHLPRALPRRTPPLHA